MLANEPSLQSVPIGASGGCFRIENLNRRWFKLLPGVGRLKLFHPASNVPRFASIDRLFVGLDQIDAGLLMVIAGKVGERKGLLF